jgi:hypothetical protein
MFEQAIKQVFVVGTLLGVLETDNTVGNTIVPAAVNF